MITWKVCVYLTDEAVPRVDEVTTWEPRGLAAPSAEHPHAHPARQFLGRPYSTMIDAGWEEIEEIEGYSPLPGYQNHTRKFLVWTEQEATD